MSINLINSLKLLITKNTLLRDLQINECTKIKVNGLSLEFGAIDRINKTFSNYIRGQSKFEYSNKKPNKKTPLKALNKKNIISQKSIGNSHFEDLITGDFIIHNRFGKGEVIKTEGEGSDKKAEVKFDTSGIKKILLKFAKYDICD